MLEIFEENGNSGAYSECGCGCGCGCNCSCGVLQPIEQVASYYSATADLSGQLYKIVEENYRTA